MKDLSEPPSLLSKFGIFLISLLFLTLFSKTSVLGNEPLTSIDQLASNFFLKSALPAKTESLFKIEFIQESQTLSFDTQYEEDHELEIGIEKIKQEGRLGSLTETYQVEFYQGEEFNRELVKSETVEPTTEIIVKGTKIVWRSLETPNGQIEYWRKLTVYATPYTAESAGKDPSSPGFGFTATGTKAHLGTIAVDPKTIPFGTKMYIPGYGIGTAEDIGGSIGANEIDLFCEKGYWWPSAWTEIYLLN